jgi:hypothetical protein
MTTLLEGLVVKDEFPTVDEMTAFVDGLARAHPDRVLLRDVGVSRQGEPIRLLTVHNPAAKARVLVIGQPHPNEPIGMATITALLERLVEDPVALAATGAEWHIVPVADPDGTRLNEGWFKGPWTREHYARHFYRPESDQQVEWTFPFSTDAFSTGEPMPETTALMAAIDTVRPTVLASLHNGEMGGGYYYASAGADEGYYRRLGELCLEHGVPLHLGDPETPFSDVLGPAVFTVPTAQQVYDYLHAVGADPAGTVSGRNSMEYAQDVEPSSRGICIELPYWRDDRSEDTSPDPSGKSLREVVLEGLDLQESLERKMLELVAAAPLAPSPFRDAVVAFASMTGYLEAQRQAAQQDPEGSRPATVAEVFSIHDNVHMFRLRLGGMLLRALAPDAPQRAEAESLFAEWCAEAAADSQATRLPVAALVGVQAAAILLTIEQSLA